MRPLEPPYSNHDVWYSSQSVGVQTINAYMKNMAKLGNLDITNKKFTNHSIRKTTVCKLQKVGVSNDKIVAVTGHRNETSLKSYSNVDADEHKKISNILSRDQSIQPPLQQYCKSSVELLNNTSNVLPSTHLLQHCSFSNCTVYFDGSHMYGSAKPPPIKKCKLIIDSDSDE